MIIDYKPMVAIKNGSDNFVTKITADSAVSTPVQDENPIQAISATVLKAKMNKA